MPEVITRFEALNAGLRDPVQLTLSRSSRLTPPLLRHLSGRCKKLQPYTSRGGLWRWAERTDVLLALHEVLPDAVVSMPPLEHPRHYHVRLWPGRLVIQTLYNRASAEGVGVERVESFGFTLLGQQCFVFSEFSEEQPT